MYKTTYKQRLNSAKISFNVWMHKTLTSWGAMLMRLGALHEPGEAIHLKEGIGPHLKSGNARVNRRKSSVKYVLDIKYSFKYNKIEYFYSEKPLKSPNK